MKQISVPEEFEKLKQAGANILLNTERVETLSQFHKPVIDKVHLSSNPKDGDVYPAKSADKDEPSRFRLTHQALLKLSAAAVVEWHPIESKRIDRMNDRNYVAYRAVGGVRRPDGTPIFFSSEYDLDFEVVEEELRELYHNKCKTWNKPEDHKKNYIESSVKRDLISKRKHKVKLCEAGAKNRVIRKSLGIKNDYTKAELEKPFIIVRMELRPDYNDPEVKRQLVEAAIKSQTRIFGQSQLTQPLIELPPSEYHEVLQDPDDSEPDPEPEEEPPPDFENADGKSQIKMLKNMAKKKGYDLKQLKAPLKDFSEKHRIDFWNVLVDMKDDDIPY